MAFKVVIPARYDSSRFPGKVLAKIKGKPMIQHVYERACQSDAEEVVIASDSPEVIDVADQLGARCWLTSNTHSSGTDRVREVTELEQWSDDTVVVNVQGDSPLISPESINQVGRMLEQHVGVDIGTLCTPIETRSELDNPNVVKVVVDACDNALYFSRAAIPFQPNEKYVDSAYRHLGIYGYRVATLRRFTSARYSDLETIECLEQLRALDVGMKIKVALATNPHFIDVDTEDDIIAVEHLLL